MGQRVTVLLTIFILTFLQLQKDSLQKASNSDQSGGLPEHPANKHGRESLPEPKGTTKTVGNISVYETEDNKNNSFALIAIHDVFGFHPHLKYVSDEISGGEDGIKVIVPDFFHGKPYDVNNFPPPNFKDEVEELFQSTGLWAKSVKTDLKNVIEFYKRKGIDSFGIFSFCWGGKMSVYAAADSDFSSTIKAAGLVHPSKVVTSDADNAKFPMILLPSNDEPDMIPFLNKLDSSFPGQSQHKRFSDMRHGFVGGRSDFNDTKIKARVEEVIKLLKSYFNQVLKTKK